MNPSAAAEPLHAIRSKLPTQVRLVYKHYPLPFHKHARVAAALAILAAGRNRFWQIHNELFSRSGPLTEDFVRQTAEKAGFNWKEVISAANSPAVAARIEDDTTLAKLVGVGGTPTIFINGRQYRGPIDLPNLEIVVSEELRGRLSSNRAEGRQN